MMVPRAFIYTSAASQRIGDKDSKSVRSSKKISRQIRASTTQEIAASLDIPYAPPTPPATKNARSTTATSEPVVIPKSRRQSRGECPQDGARRRPSKTDTIVTAIRDGHANDETPGSSPQPPKPRMKGVNEVLAATKITPPKRMRWKPKRDFRSECLAEDFNKLLVEEIKTREDGLVAGGYSHGSLEILLSPPDESALEMAESVETQHLSVRSISTESMPSLETDNESATSLSAPVTPAMNRKGSQDRRARTLSPPEDCGLDHPLLTPIVAEPPSNLPDISDLTATPSKSPRQRPPPPQPSSSFKSNLTASLRALKSAAQSVSNFTQSSTLQEDFLTRSLFSFSPSMTDDRRPPLSEDPPSPALRRYLNPTPATLAPADLHMYSEPPTQVPRPETPIIEGQRPKSKIPSSPYSCTASIQLQTYRRSRRPSSANTSGDTASAPPIFPSSIADDASSPTCPTMDATFQDELHTGAISLTRQREPRENSNFLRMVVCEMEMRRKGKFRDDAPGRAKIWLPARKMQKGRGSGDGVDVGGGVPRRWIGTVLDG